jgi:Cu-processing system permease protein
MHKIVRYTFTDLVRSRWSYVYLAFYLVLGFVLLFLNANLSKGIITLMNILTALVPMISTIFGVMYTYSAREFTELLLAQPVRRRTLFFGQYLGISLSLSCSLLIGLGVPFLAYGLFKSGEVWNFSYLLVSGIFLTFIFTALAMLVALRNENKVKGFGYAVLLWLFFSVIYDGLFLISLLLLHNYPLEKYTLVAIVFNPIDLSRIMVLLQLDISALLGYTGAVFREMFGNVWGKTIAIFIQVLWVVIPVMLLLRTASRKDF